MKKRKVITLVLLVVVLFGVSVGLIGRFLYAEFVLSRPADYTTFEPFSGKLFDLKPEEISHIDIRNSYDTPADYLHYEDKEEVREIAAFLNSFRYRYCLSGPKDERAFPAGNIAMEYIKVYPAGIDPAYYKYKALYCIVYAGERNAILVNGVWYFGDEEFFEKFSALE